MSVDVHGLRSTIRDMQQQIAGLERDVARLQQIADNAEGVTRSSADPGHDLGVPAPGLDGIGPALPSVVRVRDPHEIAAYLSRHPDMTRLVAEAAVELADEFRGDRSEIELVLYRDPEIEDRTLTFYVRVPDYEHLKERLDTVLDRLDDTLEQGSEMILITSDYRPIE